MENRGLIMVKARAYCDKAERCHSDVRNKLFQWKVSSEFHDEILSELITTQLLNEERFALAYAHDRQQFRKWGRAKIRQGLQRKRVSEPLILLALRSLKADDEWDIIYASAQQKLKRLIDEPPIKKRMKLMRYLYGKGFDIEQIHKVIEALLSP